ncbi:uncharacterized protein LAESUDRAFT_813924 [Laetiporus sulphureus 93-53]|uniref:F-box domain-containing protein n=1 Tax=Laetiporus sulphureus 93-53 TaxID=1314785 RepID=A0A165DG57_9APHY|nr:uncharacterized protein LAESUDRAFT_813924 [Laetiporus sulphureus 93-53]KZT04820.1 hypothetical protein LAESUDRAFT_813924 [Laetiporus sulphureus 93-53]
MKIRSRRVKSKLKGLASSGQQGQVSLTHLDPDALQIIADNLSVKDALSLSVACWSLRNLGLRSALRNYNPETFSPRKFVAFCNFIFADPARLSYIRSAKLPETRYSHLSQHRFSAAATMWAKSLARLLSGAPALRSLSMHSLDMMISKHPPLALDLRNCSALQHIELAQLSAQSLRHIPNNLCTLRLEEICESREGLYSLLSATSSLPHLHTLELRFVILSDHTRDEIPIYPPRVSSTVKHLILWSCQLSLISLAHAFPDVRVAEIYEMRDRHLLSCTNLSAPCRYRSQWNRLKMMHTDIVFGAGCNHVVGPIRHLILSITRYWDQSVSRVEAEVTIPQHQYRELFNLSVECCPPRRTDRVIEERMTSALQTLLPLQLERLELHYKIASGGIPHREPSQRPDILKKYLCAILKAAESLPTLTYLGVRQRASNPQRASGEDVDGPYKQTWWRFEEQDGRREACLVPMEEWKLLVDEWGSA